MLLQTLLSLTELGVGTVFPIYGSYRAAVTGDRRAQKRWLILWVVLAAVHGGDAVVGKLLKHFPLYSELKVLFLLWLVLPQFRVSACEAQLGGKPLTRLQGAETVYDSTVAPMIREHETEISSTVASAEAEAFRLASLAQKQLASLAASRGASILSMVASALSQASVDAPLLPSAEAVEERKED
jgi:hypothetical protein